MYIDAHRLNDTIKVVSRIDGQRVFDDYPAPYIFYFEDANGTHRSIFGHPCKRLQCRTGHEFRHEVASKRGQGRRIFESDINPIFRCLEDRYSGAEMPILHIGFFDIEADFGERGFAPPHDPFNAVTAISLYSTSDQRLRTYVLRPSTVPAEAAQGIADRFGDTSLFDAEAPMLEAFLTAIEDVDCLSGWSSSAYDIPYLINRAKRVLGLSAAKDFCLWGQMPREREYTDKFGKTVKSYDLIGRVHLDYIDLYRKHNPQQRLSYALNAIAEIEIGETKTAYEGTLDALYKQDFERFIEYNRQDVMLIVKIDQKLQFIQLANQIAHANCVLLKTTMGTVSLVEQAIINGFHAMDRVVPDRAVANTVEDDSVDAEEERDPVVGAYVADPKPGLHDWVGCVDLASLYPSTIRALNMSPETLVGQVLPIETTAFIQARVAKLSATKRAEAWEGLFCTLEVSHMQARDDSVLTVQFYDHLTDDVETQQMTGAALYDYVFDPANQVCISANGTLFSTAVEGMIPALLAKWFADRQAMQAQMKYFADLAEQPGNDRSLLLEQSFFWHQRQMAAKIRLNAVYGASLQQNFRFYDERLGQSTTLTGRTIVKHMNAKINQILTGEYDHVGDACISGDTDSAYFSAYPLRDRADYAGFVWSAENVIELYDAITDDTNATFPAFMRKTFNTSLARGAIIKAGRELVASRGLFIKKKKYAVLMIDKEGQRLDGKGKAGKLKAMGLDLKRADTPKFMQVFLESLLMDILTGVDQRTMYDKVKAFRQAFKDRPGWEKGSPKKVSDLSVHVNDLAQLNKRGLSGRTLKAKKSTTPGHVKASMNYHLLCELNNDRYAMRITDSARIIVCKLLRNCYDMTSIAYPIDEPRLPSWFKELPFDHAAMEDTIVDAKIENLVSVLNWDLGQTKDSAAADLFVF